MSVNEYFMIAPLTKTPGQRQRAERNKEIRLRYSEGESVDALAIAFDLSRRAITGMVYKQNLRPPVEKPPKKVKGFSARDQTIRELFATKGQNTQKIANQYGVTRSKIRWICRGLYIKIIDSICDLCSKPFQRTVYYQKRCVDCAGFRGQDALLSSQMKQQGKTRCNVCKDYFTQDQMTKSTRHRCKSCNRNHIKAYLKKKKE